jgi:hypothetical protein
MSPEQLMGDPEIDHRTDIWALGVIAFQCMTGQRPFDGGTPGALALSIHAGPPPRPSNLDTALPPAVDKWFARVCAREREARFERAGEAADALADALRGVAIAETTATRPRDLSRDAETFAASSASAVRRRSVGDERGRRHRRGRARLLATGAVTVAGMVITSLALRRTHSSATSEAEHALTHYAPGATYEVVVSPDGGTLAINDADALWLQRLGTGVRRQLALPASIDRYRIVGYRSDGKALIVRSKRAWWNVPIDTPEAATSLPLGNIPDESTAVLAPDGERVAWRSGGRVVVSVIGSREERVVVEERPRVYVTPLAWSPRGDALLLVTEAQQSLHQALSILYQDGHSQEVATTHNREFLTSSGETAAAWPTPDRIVYAMHRKVDDRASSRLLEQSVDPNGAPVGAPRTLATFATEEIPAFAIRGDRLFSQRQTARRSVHVFGLHSHTAPVRLTRNEMSAAPNGFLPDGRLVFTSNRSGQNEVYAQSLGSDAADAAIVVTGPSRGVSVTPDGEILAWRDNVERSTCVLVAVDPTTHSERAIVSGTGAAVASESSDTPQLDCRDLARCGGKTCVVGVSRPSPGFYELDRVTGIQPRLIGRPVYPWRWDLSRDGSTIFLADDYRHGAYTMLDVASGRATTVQTTTRAFLQFVTPVPGSSAFIATSMDERLERHELWRIEESGAMTLLHAQRALEGGWRYLPTVDSQGDWVAYAQLDWSSNWWESRLGEEAGER